MSKKKNNNKSRLPKNVLQTIPYQNIFKRNGIIESDPGLFTQMYKLEDINFSVAAEETQISIFKNFGSFLNSFEDGNSFQIIIHNHGRDKRSTLDDIRFLPQKDGLNKYRQEMNNVLLDKMSEGKSNITQEKYLLISSKTDSFEKAIGVLDNVEKKMLKGLKKISKESAATRLTIEERLRVLHSIYNQDREAVFENEITDDGTPYFSLDKLYQSGLTSKDAICSSGFEFHPNYFKTGNVYGRALYLHSVANWLSTDFISDISEAPCNLLLSLTYTPIEQAEGLKMVRNKMIALDSQVAETQKRLNEQGYSSGVISPELLRKQEQTRDLMNDLVSRDQKLYYITFIVTLFSDTKEGLEENTKYVISQANKYMCPLKTLQYQQEYGFNTSLPLCLNQVSVKRMYTTENASVFIPYTSQELNQKNGFFYGLNETTKNMIIYSRLSAQNYNGLIFGESGSGKSMAAKMEMLSVALRSSKNVIYVIDPDGDYGKLAKALGGEIIKLAPGSDTYINPLDMDLDYGGDDEDPITMKCDYIISLIELMLGNNRTLSPEASSMIDRCAKNIYKNYINHIENQRMNGNNISCDKEAMPTLSNLYSELLAQEDPVAESIASIIEIYATGSLNLFAHRSNVNTDAKFVVYDVRNLGTGMKNLGLYVCLNDIWNKMIENRKKDLWTWFYIDEFYLLLQSDSAPKFLMNIWKRARKWNGVPTGIMQNTEDLLRSSDTRNIINNTSFVLMMGLPKQDRMNLAELLQISESQMEYITFGEVGHGLLYNGKTTVPFSNEFPHDTELYEILSSSGTKDKLMNEA